MNYETYRQLKADPDTDILDRTPYELNSYLAWEKDAMAVWQAVKTIGQVVNHARPWEVAQMIRDQLVTEHRFIQAELITTIWETLRLYGALEPGTYTDGRNEHSRQLAKRMGEVTL